MGLPATILRLDKRFCVIALILGAGSAMLLIWPGSSESVLGIVAAVLLLLDRRQMHRRWSVRMTRRLEQVSGCAGEGQGVARLSSSLGIIAQRLQESEHRHDQRHRVTGLSTREPLIRRMAGDERGVLGVVGVMDFDRISAFDPVSGERLLLVIVDRLTRMVPAERLITQVDRATLAIWFGADVTEEQARGELDVLAYALGEGITAGECDVVPEICVRWGVLIGGGSPHALLSRTLASLSLQPNQVLPSTAPTIDPALAARERFTFEQDLRQATSRGELEMRYQPLIDAGRGRVTGAEALVRWFHPSRGSVPPGRFIPVAEAMGLAHEIGLWTLNAAVREARGWQGLGALRVAVNVSGRQLDRDDMAALVSRTLARHALSPEALEIELTESVALTDGVRAAQLLDTLRATGIRIAIDDFGTGYSSLSALRNLTFDKIKIDREFVTHVDKRRDSQAICQSIIALARGLGIGVLAEGVERYPEYEWLQRHGCSQFQGYYFAMPLTGPEFVAFVRDADGLAKLLSPPSGMIRDRIAERSLA